MNENKNALDVQIGGNHYKQFKIQPVEFSEANRLPYCYANIVKYLCRYKDKDGLKDIEKSIHYIDLWLEMEKYNPLVLYDRVIWKIPTETFIKENNLHRISNVLEHIESLTLPGIRKSKDEAIEARITLIEAKGMIAKLMLEIESNCVL